MNKWAFIVEIKNYKEIKKAVKNKAEKVAKSLPPPAEGTALYKVSVIYYQKEERWKEIQEGIFLPREYIGIDVDNFLKLVLDSLWPIIGRKDEGKKENGKFVSTGKKRKRNEVKDHLIIEVVAKKVNSGSEKEYLGIEVEAVEILPKKRHPQGNKKKPKLDWIGGLKEYQNKYTAIELQKKALEWQD